jgi:hypothetical protein
MVCDYSHMAVYWWQFPMRDIEVCDHSPDFEGPRDLRGASLCRG